MNIPQTVLTQRPWGVEGGIKLLLLLLLLLLSGWLEIFPPPERPPSCRKSCQCEAACLQCLCKVMNMSRRAFSLSTGKRNKGSCLPQD